MKKFSSLQSLAEKANGKEIDGLVNVNSQKLLKVHSNSTAMIAILKPDS